MLPLVEFVAETLCFCLIRLNVSIISTLFMFPQHLMNSNAKYTPSD